jgi:UDP-N-acetylglucosamine diphosphorylase / glucose-1-phosphate thymidylyltransferase / UDP-N-acetylgalactosamine diphosphorylase / glucosamine-1-phosphate N-acetyltransferase / galactosamine-1-phosphate N-acetyltransferase
VQVDIGDFIASWRSSRFFTSNLEPWNLTASAPELIGRAIASLTPDFHVRDDVAVHRTAVVEDGAVVKGPAIIGPRAFVASSAYLRGGVVLDEDCTVGPACELKTSFLFPGAKVAHLSFVGDSVLGSAVNIEAGAIIANYRNEMDDKRIRIARDGFTIDTGVEKFGALIGDGAKIGANTTIAPGALIAPGRRIPRLSRIDQHPSPLDE